MLNYTRLGEIQQKFPMLFDQDFLLIFGTGLFLYVLFRRWVTNNPDQTRITLHDPNYMTCRVEDVSDHGEICRDALIELTKDVRKIRKLMKKNNSSHRILKDILEKQQLLCTITKRSDSKVKDVQNSNQEDRVEDLDLVEETYTREETENIEEVRRDRRAERKLKKQEQKDCAVRHYLELHDFQAVLKWLRKGANPNLLTRCETPLIIEILSINIELTLKRDKENSNVPMSHDMFLKLLQAVLRAPKFSMCTLKKFFNKHILYYYGSNGLTFLTLLLVYHKKAATELIADCKNYKGDEDELGVLTTYMDAEMLESLDFNNKFRLHYDQRYSWLK